MRLAALASLACATALAQPVDKCSDPLYQNTPQCRSALFQFAPASGAGMGAACACTTPTGSKGEALTFARASSGTCLRGNISTGISNGDMSTCTSNQPRIMPGGSGAHPLGLLIEGARTNSTLRSQELDNAAWSDSANVVAAPTTTANAGVAPDGTTTAERLQVPATAGGSSERSFRRQVNCCPAAAASGSVFIKGVSGDGTIDMCNHNGTAWACTACTYVSTSWTRCTFSNITQGASNEIDIGNGSQVNGGIARSANDVYVWGLQCEAGAFPTSYIATAGATVTRATETASFAVAMSEVSGSVAATVVPHAAALCGTAADCGFVALSQAGPTYQQLLFYSQSGTEIRFGSSTGNSAGNISFTPTANTPIRAAGYWDASNIALIVNGTQFAGGVIDVFNTSDIIEIGTYSGANPIHGVIKRVCADSDPGRCR